MVHLCKLQCKLKIEHVHWNIWKSKAGWKSKAIKEEKLWIPSTSLNLRCDSSLQLWQNFCYNLHNNLCRHNWGRRLFYWGPFPLRYLVSHANVNNFSVNYGNRSISMATGIQRSDNTRVFPIFGNWIYFSFNALAIK